MQKCVAAFAAFRFKRAWPWLRPRVTLIRPPPAAGPGPSVGVLRIRIRQVTFEQFGVQCAKTVAIAHRRHSVVIVIVIDVIVIVVVAIPSPPSSSSIVAAHRHRYMVAINNLSSIVVPLSLPH